MRSFRAFVILVLLLTACSHQRGSAQATSTSSAAPAVTTSTSVPPTNLVYRVRHADLSILLSGSLRGTLDIFVAAPIGRGPFPLIIFNHGLGSNARAYAPLLDEIARHGFVLAGPNFTDNDIHDNSVEISRTIDLLTSPSANPLARLVDPKHIGVLGHSFGGLTVSPSPITRVVATHASRLRSPSRDRSAIFPTARTRGAERRC